MKVCLFLLLIMSSTVRAESGNVCLHIPIRGAETTVIQQYCKKGDIIQLHRQLVAYLCDFDKAIIHYDGTDQFMCAFLGEKRRLREGTNP